LFCSAVSFADVRTCIPAGLKAEEPADMVTSLRSKDVFLNEEGTPIEIETLRKNAWSKGLKAAGLEYRPVIQTRHTFATMMISSRENLGWVQKMMGHTTLKMITDKYFSYIPNITHKDGTKFVEEFNKKTGDFTPVLHQAGNFDT
jgi:integrase